MELTAVEDFEVAFVTEFFLGGIRTYNTVKAIVITNAKAGVAECSGTFDVLAWVGNAAEEAEVGVGEPFIVQVSSF